MNDREQTMTEEFENPADSTPDEKKGMSTTLKGIIFGVVAISLFVSFLVFDISEYIKNLLNWINGLGAIGPIIFGGVYVLACVLFVPGSLLTLGAGAIFGVFEGTIYVSLASTTGAAFAFLLGRYFARDAIAKKVEGNERFAAIDKAVAKEGWKIVLLTRLSPVFPFNLLNYAFGLTPVKFWHYLWASWIGMLPGTLMYVYLGDVAGNVATLGAGERETTAADWAIRIIGLLATIGVTFYVTKIAKRALNAKVDVDVEES